jgi:hypothetical protein
MRTHLTLPLLFLLALLSKLHGFDLPVIKDSEAAQFVGQNVEVKGLVVAVHTSRKGNTGRATTFFRTVTAAGRDKIILSSLIQSSFAG